MTTNGLIVARNEVVMKKIDPTSMIGLNITTMTLLFFFQYHFESIKVTLLGRIGLKFEMNDAFFRFSQRTLNKRDPRSG